MGPWPNTDQTKPPSARTYLKPPQVNPFTNHYKPIWTQGVVLTPRAFEVEADDRCQEVIQQLYPNECLFGNIFDLMVGGSSLPTDHLLPCERLGRLGQQ